MHLYAINGAATALPPTTPLSRTANATFAPVYIAGLVGQCRR